MKIIVVGGLDMSYKQIQIVKCPNCKEEQSIEIWGSVNELDRDIFPKIVDGTIFDYRCEHCGETIHAPHPLLFHKMGVRDIQIGYLVKPVDISSVCISPFNIAMKNVLKQKGYDSENIVESYDDEIAFRNRVSEFI